jgi:hypothetical protein
MYYEHAKDWVTVSATDGSDELTVFCRTRTRNRLSDRISTPSRVADLVSTLADAPVKDQSGRFRGLGLPYSLIVQVLDSMYHSGSIAAPVALQSASITDLLGPQAQPQRPEGDEDQPETAPEPSANPPPSAVDAPDQATLLPTPASDEPDRRESDR